MANVKIQFVGFTDLQEGIAIDGKFVKIKQDNDKKLNYSFETEKDTFEIEVYKTHCYTGKNWFWWNLLYFFISIFGLFDIRQNKRCLVQNCKFKIAVQPDQTVIVRRQDFKDGEKLALVEIDASVEEIANVQYYDKEGAKRHSKMKKFKIATTILSVALAVVLIVVL